METFLGQICLFGFNYAPRGWAKCDGQLLYIDQYSALFSLLGSTYGGNGRTTFALPDLRGRVPIGDGQGVGLQVHQHGKPGGAEAVKIEVAHVPAHTHKLVVENIEATCKTTLRCKDGEGNTDSPNGNFPAKIKSKAFLDAYSTIDDTDMSETTSTVNFSINKDTNSVGGNQPLLNMQPFLAMNYCIALDGIYPSRS